MRGVSDATTDALHPTVQRAASRRCTVVASRFPSLPLPEIATVRGTLHTAANVGSAEGIG